MGSGYSMPRRTNEIEGAHYIPVENQTQRIRFSTPNEKNILDLSLNELTFLTHYKNSYHSRFIRRETLVRHEFLFIQIKSIAEDLISSGEITLPEMPAPRYSDEDSVDDIYDQNYVDYLKSCVIFLNDFCNSFS